MKIVETKAACVKYEVLSVGSVFYAEHAVPPGLYMKTSSPEQAVGLQTGLLRAFHENALIEPIDGAFVVDYLKSKGGP